ncbi:hypothetical protein LY76DRAFT_125973 [Colletotrichum caudatum]|nr:hypothetical protein LY76DRAFT_125973 [Colletotrichum caudatum]
MCVYIYIYMSTSRPGTGRYGVRRRGSFHHLLDRNRHRSYCMQYVYKTRTYPHQPGTTQRRITKKKKDEGEKKRKRENTWKQVKDAASRQTAPENPRETTQTEPDVINSKAESARSTTKLVS